MYRLDAIKHERLLRSAWPNALNMDSYCWSVKFTTLNIYIHIKTSRRSIYIHAFKLRPDVTTEQCISVDHSIRKTSLTNAIQASGSWNQRFRSSSIKNTVSLKLMNCYGAKQIGICIILLLCSFEFYFGPSVQFVNELAVKRLHWIYFSLF